MEPEACFATDSSVASSVRNPQPEAQSDSIQEVPPVDQEKSKGIEDLPVQKTNSSEDQFKTK